MKCGHLFNGIGGFALAAHWMGWENIMHCEIDPFCNKVMNYHFPNSYQHEDIRTTDFTIWRNRIDLLTGGWPCQPVSTAGKRKGKEDVRYLWPENIRAVREIRPRIVVGENVRGLTNWQGGVLFDEVQADLEAEGYEVLPFLLPACAVNAPHRRDRIWFIAHAIGYGYGCHEQSGQTGCTQKAFEGEKQREERDEIQRQWNGGNVGGVGTEDVVADTDGNGIDGRASISNELSEKQQEWGRVVGQTTGPGTQWSFTDSTGLGGVQSLGQSEAGQFDKENWQQFPTQSPVRNGNDGIPDRLAGITVPRWRREGIKALGNAIVPQVAYQIFKAVEQYNKLTQ